MEEFVNKEGTDNHVGVSDDIGKEMLQNQIDSYKEELKSYKEAVSQAEKSIKNYNDQWLIDKELMDLELENFGRKPEHCVMKVHDLPRFWELQKEKFKYTIRQEVFKAESYLDQQEVIKNKALEQINIIESNLKRLKND